MTNKTATSNEEIIAALLQHGTIKEAALSIGISARTIYDRMQNDKEFRAEYIATKTDIMRGATSSINKKIGEAVDAIAQIMTDPAINAAVRLQAAQTILTNAVKFAERLAQDERDAIKDDDDPLGDLFNLFQTK